MKGINHGIVIVLAVCALFSATTLTYAKTVRKKTNVVVQQPININQADVKALTTLPNMSERHARAIVNYRKKHGLFESVDDLSKVRGISKQYVKKNKAYLQLDNDR